MSQKKTTPVGPLNYHSIHSACIRGDRAQVKHLSGTSEPNVLELKDESGKTPLIYATIGNHLECINILLKAGAIVDNADNSGQTALHWAAFKGQWQCVKTLLEKGAIWYRKDLDGVTPLHLAAVHKSSRCLQLFLQAGNHYTNYDLWDSAKKTALHWSASVANYDHMKLLLKKDANVNIPDVEGRTPLHWAAACNRPQALDCVKLLLASSPSVLHEEWQDYQGQTALHLAVITGTKEVVDALNINGKSLNLQDNMFRTPLHWAALMGLSEKVKVLLDLGPNLDARDANGATPLHYAAYGDHAETVSVFLSRKVVHDKADNNGCTALLWAAARGADKVLQIMQQHGADLNATDQHKNTTLHAASLQGHASSVEWLIEQGCRTDAKNSCGQTALLLACQVGRFKVVKVLLTKDSASLHVRDSKGRTAIHCAAIGGHALICQELLKYEADPNVQDFYGLSPLHYASYKGHLNCMSVLIENGTHVNCADNLGQTSIHWVCYKGKLESLKFLHEVGGHLNSLSIGPERNTPLDYSLQNGNSAVLEYLTENNAVSSEFIINLAALIIQKFMKNCYRKRQKKPLKQSLDVKSQVQDNNGETQINSYRSKSSDLTMLQNNKKMVQTVNSDTETNKIHLNQKSTRGNLLLNPSNMSNIIFINNVDIPENGNPVIIQGHCLDCYSKVIIKSPIDKYIKSGVNSDFLTGKLNLKVLAAIIIQRTWRNYIQRKRNLQMSCLVSSK